MTTYQTTLLIIAIIVGAVLGIISRNNKKAHRKETPRKEFSPVLLRARVRCPFYGFQIHPGIGLIDMGANCNQCALKDGHSPCNYVYEDQGPQWPCKFVAANVVPEFKASQIKVYPRETADSEGRNTGVTFAEWDDMLKDQLG